MTDIQKFANKNRLRTRVDDDLTKIIPGRIGHIYEYDLEAEQPFGVIIMPDPPRPHYWGFAKRALFAAGCTVVQDGDGEGAAAFNPADAGQLKAAIKAAGIKRIRTPSPKQLEVLARMNSRNAQEALRTQERADKGKVTPEAAEGVTKTRKPPQEALRSQVSQTEKSPRRKTRKREPQMAS